MKEEQSASLATNNQLVLTVPHAEPVGCSPMSGLNRDSVRGWLIVWGVDVIPP